MAEPLGWKPWDIERVTDYTILALIEGAQKRDERLEAEMNGYPSGIASDPGQRLEESLRENPRMITFEEYKGLFGNIPKSHEELLADYEGCCADFKRMHPESAPGGEAAMTEVENDKAPSRSLAEVFGAPPKIGTLFVGTLGHLAPLGTAFPGMSYRSPFPLSAALPWLGPTLAPAFDSFRAAAIGLRPVLDAAVEQREADRAFIARAFGIPSAPADASN